MNEIEHGGGHLASIILLERIERLFNHIDCLLTDYGGYGDYPPCCGVYSGLTEAIGPVARQALHQVQWLASLTHTNEDEPSQSQIVAALPVYAWVFAEAAYDSVDGREAMAKAQQSHPEFCELVSLLRSLNRWSTAGCSTAAYDALVREGDLQHILRDKNHPSDAS